MEMIVEPVTLEGQLVRLELLGLEHATDLFAAQDASVWRYMAFKDASSITQEDIVAWIQLALKNREKGTEMPFAIIERASNRAVGSTRYMDIRPYDRGLEIGWTWLASAQRRTGINTECKYLLMRHAFETLGAIRLQLKTHHRNEVSQRAIERIGGIKEGVLRNHIIMPDGSYRHSVYYSILDKEWPVVKSRLEGMMG